MPDPLDDLMHRLLGATVASIARDMPELRDLLTVRQVAAVVGAAVMEAAKLGLLREPEES